MRPWKFLQRLTAASPALAAVFVCGAAKAGAWPTPDGETQAIAKYERAVADEAFDPNGVLTPIVRRTDESYSLFVEHGLTGRITLQGKAAWTRGGDQFVSYQGRGPIELGGRIALLKGRTAVSLYAGAVLAGEGRNAGYATPGAGNTDIELRLLGGRSGVFFKRPVFAEAQLAHFSRDGLPDEVRVDTTVGFEPARRWLILWQTYAGLADSEPVSPYWQKAEISLVRSFGDWRAQAGWRAALSGRETPAETGPVLGLWRNF